MKKQIKSKYTLWEIIKPIISEIRVSMVLSAIATLSSLLSFVVLSFILTFLIERSSLEIFGIELTLSTMIITLSILGIISFLLKFASYSISHFAAFKLERILRTKISTHLAKVPLSYIILNGSGTFNKIMQNDVKSLHAFIADSIPMIAKCIVSPIATLIILFIIDYRFAIISVIVLVIGFISMVYAMKDSKVLRQRYDKSQTDINKSLVEFIQAIPVIRIFEDSCSTFYKYNNALDSYKRNLIIWMNQSSVYTKISMIILSPLPTILSIMFAGIIFLDNNTLDIFSFIVALILSTGMADSLMPVMWLQSYIKKSQASAIKILELLDTKTLSVSSNEKTPKSFDLEFKDVSFQYENKPILKNINFKVAQNNTLAIVGSSGAGKSTIAKLISRFWDINSGKILIGGINIKDMRIECLMDNISFVFQDSFLFNDTIFNNIKISNINASEEDVIEAAKAAQIHDFIITLPEAYNTNIIDRGNNLSGGQKQRITIARAILRDTPIIVLDEATSSTDSKNEGKIIQALQNLRKNKTVIMIAHRLSTIADANEILVLNKGEIIESGKHNDLLKLNGTYKSLYKIYKQTERSNNLEENTNG